MSNQTKALQYLKEGFKTQFAEYVLDSPEFSELLMELSLEFVMEHIPIQDEDLQLDMSLMLVETIGL